MALFGNNPDVQALSSFRRIHPDRPLTIYQRGEPNSCKTHPGNSVGSEEPPLSDVPDGDIEQAVGRPHRRLLYGSPANAAWQSVLPSSWATWPTKSSRCSRKNAQQTQQFGERTRAPTVEMGPCRHAPRRWSRIEGYIDVGVKGKAADAGWLDGTRSQGAEKGKKAFFQPAPRSSIGSAPDMRIYKEEIFGPRCLCCVRVEDFAAAVKFDHWPTISATVVSC